VIPPPPPENSSDEDELGKELSNVKDGDKPDAEIINPDSYNPFDSVVSKYAGRLSRSEHDQMHLGTKMGKSKFACEGVGFIDGLPSNKELKRIANIYTPTLKQDNMNAGASAQVFHGHYEINGLANQEAEKHGQGRVLSGGSGGDPSKFIEILWSPVVGSVKDGGTVVDSRGKSISQVMQIVEDRRPHELKIAMEDMLAVSIEHKMNLFTHEILLGRAPHLFWNVVYRAQPKVKPTAVA
jgi:hypothetical protein